jgi:hypothetical protein
MDRFQTRASSPLKPNPMEAFERRAGISGKPNNIQAAGFEWPWTGVVR